MNTINDIDNRIKDLQKEIERLTIKREQVIEDRDNESNDKTEPITKSERIEVNQRVLPTPKLYRDSFEIGDLVQVTNSYKGQFGTIGRVYKITRKQVHFQDLRCKEKNLSRIFSNVIIIKVDKDRERQIIANYLNNARRG